MSSREDEIRRWIEGEGRAWETCDKLEQASDHLRYLLEKVERLEGQYVNPPFDLSHLGMSEIVELAVAADLRYSELKKQQFREAYPDHPASKKRRRQ